MNGKVVGLDGKPAANVRIVVWKAEGEIVSDNGAALIGKTKRKLLQAAQTYTDHTGNFQIALSGPANIEAIQSDDVKAIHLDANATSQLTLNLERTGAFAGRVVAAGVTDYEGVDVFIPGTGYLAKAARDGHFLIGNVATGRFTLVASRPGLGRGALNQIAVAAGTTVSLPDLNLISSSASITGTVPQPVIPGQPFSLVGSGFGASSGKTFQVTLDGLVADAKRLDDEHLVLSAPTSSERAPIVKVSVDGIAGAGFALPVLQGLGLEPLRSHFMPGEHIRYTVLTHDLLDAIGETDIAQISIEGDSLQLKDGEIRALRAGKGRVLVKVGPISYARPIFVSSSGPYMEPYAGISGTGSIDGPVARAVFHKPQGLALAPDGMLYVADTLNHAIRRISPDGVVTTLKVTGLNSPIALAWSGRLASLVVVDQGNSRVCTVSPEGKLSTLADGLAIPSGVAIAPDGAIFITEWDHHVIRELLPGGGSRVLAGTGTPGFKDGQASEARFHFPAGIAADGAGHLYVCDSQNHRIRMINRADGRVSTLAGSSLPGSESGDFADGPGQQAGFYWPMDLALEPSGNLLVSDTGNGVLRRVTPTGDVSSVTSENGLVPATFQTLGSICAGSDGRVFISDPKLNQIHIYHPE